MNISPSLERIQEKVLHPSVHPDMPLADLVLINEEIDRFKEIMALPERALLKFEEGTRAPKEGDTVRRSPLRAIKSILDYRKRRPA